MVEEHEAEQASPVAVSRPFDVNRWSDYPELNNCLTVLVHEIEGGEGRRRNRSDKDAKRFRARPKKSLVKSASCDSVCLLRTNGGHNGLD